MLKQSSCAHVQMWTFPALKLLPVLGSAQAELVGNLKHSPIQAYPGMAED